MSCQSALKHHFVPDVFTMLIETAILVIGLYTRRKIQTSDDSVETQLADIGTNINENLSTVF